MVTLRIPEELDLLKVVEELLQHREARDAVPLLGLRQDLIDHVLLLLQLPEVLDRLFALLNCRVEIMRLLQVVREEAKLNQAPQVEQGQPAQLTLTLQLSVSPVIGVSDELPSQSRSSTGLAGTW